MKRTARSKVEMGVRARDFSLAHPDPDPGYDVAITELGRLLTHASELAGIQVDGFIQVRNATDRKEVLRRTMTQQYFDHLAWVARRAAVEAPDLERQLALGRVTGERTLLGFRTAARSMAETAAAQKELLAKYGLSGSMFDQLRQALDDFDAAIAQGNAGRQKHVGATAELDKVADEIVEVVAVLNGINRARFARDREALRAWETASNVITVHPPADQPPAPPAPPAPGGTAQSVQPAA